MSRMSTEAMLRCRRCGRPVVVSHLETYFPDESGKQLFPWMQGLSKIAMCERCLGEYNHKAKDNRADDWAAGRP